MIYIILFLAATVVLGFLPFYIKRLTKKMDFSRNFKIFIALFTVIVFLAIVMSWVMNQFDWFWRGYKTSIYLLIVFCICASFMYITTNFKASLYKIMVEIILFLLVLFSSLISIFNLAEYNRNLFFSEDNYRLESSYGLLSPYKLPDLYVGDRVFEKKYKLNPIGEYPIIYKSEVESCKIIEQESGYSVIFIMKEGSEIKTSTFYNELIEYNN